MNVICLLKDSKLTLNVIYQIMTKNATLHAHEAKKLTGLIGQGKNPKGLIENLKTGG